MQSTPDIDQVRRVLQQFQDGYTRRDGTAVDAFMDLFISGPELEVIGTGASEVGREEWCLGRESLRALVAGDWEGWGDLRLDVPGARIYSLGDVAWLATSGTVSTEIQSEPALRNNLKYFANVSADENKPPSARMAEIVRQGTILLAELQQGEHYTWPIRFTAVLVRTDSQWRFHQMQFSFATTTFPDVRL